MNLTFSSVAVLLSQVSLDDRRPVINLSGVRSFQPYGLIYLGMYLRHHNSLGKTFGVTMPEGKAREYLARVRFWDRFNFNPDVIERERLLRITASTSLNDILDIERSSDVDEIAMAVGDIIIRNGVPIRADAVVEVVSELVDNFAQHSGRTLGAMAIQYYPKRHRLELAIGDCGIGIRASLASNLKYADLATKPHEEAALKAFEPLVSRRPEGGMGLWQVKEMTERMKGAVRLATGDGCVIIRDQKVQTGRMALDLPGVQIALSIPTR